MVFTRCGVCAPPFGRATSSPCARRRARGSSSSSRSTRRCENTHRRPVSIPRLECQVPELASRDARPLPTAGGAGRRHALPHDVARLHDPACVYEGVLSFVTTVCSSNRESPHKLRMGRQNDKRPSSKPGRVRAAALLGSGRIVASQKEAPNMLAILV